MKVALNATEILKMKKMELKQVLHKCTASVQLAKLVGPVTYFASEAKDVTPNKGDETC